MASVNSGMVKTLCVGNVYCGKTSVIRRYVRSVFDDNYSTTVGVDFMLKSINVEGTEIKVQMWDIAGQERFLGLSRAFYMHAGGAIVVFDLLDRKSFESAAKWKKDIDDKIELPNGMKLPVLLLGNKCDLLMGNNNNNNNNQLNNNNNNNDSNDTPRPDACVSQEGINQFVQQHGFYRYWPCSALDGTNVTEAIDDLVAEVVRRMRHTNTDNNNINNNNNNQLNNNNNNNYSSSSSGYNNTVKIGGDAPSSKSEGGCC